MSAELVERFSTHAGKMLGADERTLAAVKVSAVGTKSAEAWLAPFDARPVAEALPVSYLLVLTDRRVLAARCTLTGRPKSLAAEWDAAGAELRVEDRGDRVRVRRVAVHLGDGTAIVADIPINGAAAEGADEFVASFTTADRPVAVTAG